MMSMGPCLSENVSFKDSFTSTPPGGYYVTNSWFEYDIIEKNKKNHDFCLGSMKNIDAVEENREDLCEDFEKQPSW